MDLLDSILQNLSSEERAEYLTYMSKVGRNSKEIKLFKVRNSSKVRSPRDIAAKLYSPVNMNAYHSLRKRLVSQISEFIVLKRLRLDVDAEGGVLSLISMGKFMLEKGDYKAAAHFLLKAEQTALRNRQYELLENIYKLLVNNAEFLKLNLEQIIKRWDENFEKYRTFRKLIMAHGTIRQELSEARINCM